MELEEEKEEMEEEEGEVIPADNLKDGRSVNHSNSHTMVMMMVVRREKLKF
jgi:hypothetical protein